MFKRNVNCWLLTLCAGGIKIKLFPRFCSGKTTRTRRTEEIERRQVTKTSFLLELEFAPLFAIVLLMMSFPYLDKVTMLSQQYNDHSGEVGREGESGKLTLRKRKV